MKKLLLPVLAILLFASCKKQVGEEKTSGSNATEESTIAAAKANKINVCHREGNGSYHMININVNALPAHLAHGDIVPDADGDGYTKVNPCGEGNQDDCNDDNAAIHPGATEICGNSIDDNCNGQIDENCNFCSVTICDQLWMCANLDVSTYRNGDPIPEVTDAAAWTTLTTGAWCYYNNDPANGAVYGKLYNWYAVNDPRGLAPSGWHVASDAEWTTLAKCLDPDADETGSIFQSLIAGGPLKTTGTIQEGTGLWFEPNVDATNSTGWSGLPSGNRYYEAGNFKYISFNCAFWTSTESTGDKAWARALVSGSAQLNRPNNPKRLGAPVRCIRD